MAWSGVMPAAWNYGKFDDADHPRYNFAREVDYCTGGRA